MVTYEALACGLPSVVTPAAGSVVRDGVEGFVVAPRDVDALARRMEQLGGSPRLRARMAAAARARALEFDWPRYHDGVINAIEQLKQESLVPSHRGDGLKTPELHWPRQPK